MKILLVSFIGFLLISPLGSYAAHTAGLELKYEHLTGNDYRIHYIFYRDCSGIPVSSSYTILGKSACGNNISIAVNLDSTADMSQMCEGDSNQCLKPWSPFTGIEANYYHGDVTLPALCSLWTFSNIPICNRNNSITNLMGGGNSWCYYIEAKLNNADFPDNSSPVYNALPVFFQETQIRYQHFYATDADGDSLVFEMYTPHTNDSTDVQYINGLSAYQPITFAVQADSTGFNPATGDIRYKASVAQVTVVGVRVNEYRNGSFAGSAERDMEVIFNNSTSHAPTASGINGTTSYTAHICADSLLNFYITTTDADGDSIRISWQNNTPASSVGLSGADSNIVNFSWHPQASDISPVPYTFTLYVTDSTCPYVYSNSYQYLIYVDSCFAITGIDNPGSVISFNASYIVSEQSINYLIEFSDAMDGKLCLIDLQGRNLWTDEMKSTKKFSGKIPASSLSSGLYLLEMKTSKGLTKTIKVMKN